MCARHTNHCTMTIYFHRETNCKTKDNAAERFPPPPCATEFIDLAIQYPHPGWRTPSPSNVDKRGNTRASGEPPFFKEAMNPYPIVVHVKSLSLAFKMFSLIFLTTTRICITSHCIQAGTEHFSTSPNAFQRIACNICNKCWESVTHLSADVVYSKTPTEKVM